MKLLRILSTVLFLAVLQVSCEDYSAETPEIYSIEIVELRQGDNEDIEADFVIHCSTDNVVVWWGDEDSDYDAYLDLISDPDTSANQTRYYPKGQAFNDPSLWDGYTKTTHTYDSPGSYDVIVIASNIGDFAEDIKTLLISEATNNPANQLKGWRKSLIEGCQKLFHPGY